MHLVVCRYGFVVPEEDAEQQHHESEEEEEEEAEADQEAEGDAGGSDSKQQAAADAGKAGAKQGAEEEEEDQDAVVAASRDAAAAQPTGFTLATTHVSMLARKGCRGQGLGQNWPVLQCREGHTAISAVAGTKRSQACSCNTEPPASACVLPGDLCMHSKSGPAQPDCHLPGYHKGGSSNCKIPRDAVIVDQHLHVDKEARRPVESCRPTRRLCGNRAGGSLAVQGLS